MVSHLNTTIMISSPNMVTTAPNVIKNFTGSNWTLHTEHKHVMTPMSVVVAVASSLLCVTGFIGNLIIAVIIVKRKKMQTPTNWFILNLTICDLAIICTSIPLTLIHHVNAYLSFPFGKIGCKYVIMPVLEHFASVSVLTHTAISFARYTVISRSGFRGYIRARFVGFIIFLIWSLSFLVLSATLMGILGYFELYTDAVGRSYCRLHWVSSERRYVYRITVFLLTYIIPMLMTGKSYYTIHTVVRDSLHRVNSLLTESMLRTRSRKLHQMNTTLTVMYTTFAILTLPFQVFFCLFDFGVVEKSDTNFVIFDIFLVLFYAQILSNPFVLLYVGDEYRKELRYARVTLLPRVNRWSRKMEGSPTYRRQDPELTSHVDLEELCSSDTSKPSTLELKRQYGNTLCVPDSHNLSTQNPTKSIEDMQAKNNRSISQNKSTSQNCLLLQVKGDDTVDKENLGISSGGTMVKNDSCTTNGDRLPKSSERSHNGVGVNGSLKESSF